ncbi:MAG: M20/M25/M40 family metallo-hydrolase [Candidatus Diapherotrites archaeon]
MDEMRYEIGLLRNLVALDTDSDQKKNYVRIAKLLGIEAKKLGLRAKTITYKSDEGKPCPNLFISLDKKAKETILLATHYDVVPAGEGWTADPFKLRRKGKMLIGRGACDDKGAIAAAMGALKELKNLDCRRNVKLLVACDEEVGAGNGLKKLIAKNKKDLISDFCIVMDKDFTNVGIGCSGTAMGYIFLKGEQGHAGYPHKTLNIVHEAVPFMADLLEYKKLREMKKSVAPAPPGSLHKTVWGRFSITMLNAGHKTNIIPSSLRIGFDIRALPEEKINGVIKEFKKFVGIKLKKHNLRGRITIKGSNGYMIRKDNPYVEEVAKKAEKILGRKLEKVVELGAVDGRFIAKLGISAIAITPGGKNAHAPEESISIYELRKTKELVKELVR